MLPAIFKLFDNCRYIHVKLSLTKISKCNCILTGLSNTYKTHKKEILKEHTENESVVQNMS